MDELDAFIRQQNGLRWNEILRLREELRQLQFKVYGCDVAALDRLLAKPKRVENYKCARCGRKLRPDQIAQRRTFCGGRCRGKAVYARLRANAILLVGGTG